MHSRTHQIQPELKTTRQLVVRFVHAPSVKLTLLTRPESAPSPNVGRVLRLQTDSAPCPVGP
jgi:hypothetical protein